MKKLLVLAALIIASLCLLASCGGQKDDHTHEFGEWSVTKNATCTEDGIKTRYCSCGEKQSDTIPATDHNKQVIPAVESTCTENGLTEGIACSACGEVFVAQQTIPEIAHTYDDKYDETCNKCGFVRDAECAHTETEVIKGYAATCTSVGLTDGTKCKKCAEILVAQTIIPVIDHSFGDWVTVKNPTVTEQGTKERYCACGAKETDSIPMLKASEGLKFTSKGDGTCYISGIGTCTDTDLVIPATHNGESVTSIGSSAFSGCSSLESVVIPDSVTNIYSNAFIDCSSLTSIAIPDSVTNIGDRAFRNCSSLTSVVIGNSVTSIGQKAFSGCSKLTSIVIPDSVTSIDFEAFKDCSSLTSVVLGDSVTSIDSSAFYRCSSLTSVTIPDSVTSIGYEVFEYCSNLTSVIIGNSVTNIGDEAFSSCSQLQFNEYENCKYLGSKDTPYYALIEVTTQNLSSYTIHEDTKVIAASAFSSCSKLTSIVIPDNVISIGEWAFSYCDGLTSVVIGDSVTSIGEWAFNGCSSLISVVIPNSVTSIGSSAFEGCSSLTSVVIPDSVTSIDYGVFWGCSSLASVVIGDSVTSIDHNAFYECTSLQDVYYTGTETEWTNISIGSSNDYLTNATIHYNYAPEN